MSARYRRPRRVSRYRDAEALRMQARIKLIELLFGPMNGPRREWPGNQAIEIRNAIETLEARCENLGALELDHFEPAPPVTAAELAAVRECIREHQAELAERRARRGGAS